MKKLLALIVALMMALTCLSALADTVVTKVTVDRDVAKELLPGFGVPEEQLGMIDAVLAVVNALDVRVTSVADGAQIDIGLNDADALSLGFAADDAGATIVSTLFPNYALTIQNETIAQMMEQFMANMPDGGEGGAGGFDMAAMQEVFGGHIQKWMEACASAGQPGEPVPGEYEFEGLTFDTMVPVTVDMATITQATETLLNDLLADPAAMGMIKGMAQGMAQNSGEALNEETFEADFKAGFEEWMSHFPDTVTAEVYTNEGDETGAFYMYAESAYEGEAEPFFTADMLYTDEQHMTMGYQMTIEDQTTEAGFSLDGSNMSMYFTMADVFFGLNITVDGAETIFDVYFMNTEQPLLSVSVEITEDGDRTLPVDAEGKTVLAIEDIMANGNGEAAQGLYADIQTNGLGALMSVAMQQVPELGTLMGMAG